VTSPVRHQLTAMMHSVLGEHHAYWQLPKRRCMWIDLGVMSRWSAVPRCPSGSVQALYVGLRLSLTGGCPALFLPVSDGLVSKP
jgi:hypothetical protein